LLYGAGRMRAQDPSRVCAGYQYGPGRISFEKI